MPDDPHHPTLADLTAMVLRFRDDRDWAQFHGPKDVALSLSLEAAELLEIMQWRNGPALDEHLRAEQEHLGQELSDILAWVLILAHDQGIDLAQAFVAKIAHNAAKYPIAKARGVARKYTELDR
jgi:NTP pyrophosphatase (non-canonical NTP hydrolase)